MTYTSNTDQPAPGLTADQRRNIAARLREIESLEADISTERAHIASLLASDQPGAVVSSTSATDSRAPSCDRCGAAGRLLIMPSKGELYCPDCAGSVARFEAATEAAHALLWPTFRAWARHWSAAGVSESELLDCWSIASSFEPDGVEKAIARALTDTSN